MVPFTTFDLSSKKLFMKHGGARGGAWHGALGWEQGAWCKQRTKSGTPRLCLGGEPKTTGWRESRQHVNYLNMCAN